MSNYKQTELKRNKGDSRDVSLLSASSLHEGQSNMQMWRRRWEPCLPHILRSPLSIKEVAAFEGMGKMERSDVSAYFPLTSGNSLVKFEAISDGSSSWEKFPTRRIGVVLSGGQASGGHNVIAGLMSYIKLCNQSSQLFGFLGGPEGVYTEKYRELTEEDINGILNQGGFNVICSGRHKIETEDQMRASLEICEKLKLHGLVVIGGDDSNTNAAVLAEYFKRNSSSTVVVGCPKTIDGDLKNEVIETSFGYDTAVKTYSEQIGSIMDAIKTEGNGYYFVRLMGRSASHITLECGLQTRANMILIGEEIKEENRSLMSIVDEIVEMILKRDSLGKKHGIVLLPEGLIEFIPEFETLIKELNLILLKTNDRGQIVDSLNKEMKALFLELPSDVQNQLLLERDPHGNVQVAKIATEELLVHMARERLEKVGKDHILNNVKTHYFGYEGRCALPSNFDASYCFALGHTAAALIDNQRSGYMAVVRKLSLAPEQWEPAGCPLTYMMNIELRKGKSVPVIKKYLVDLNGQSYLAYCQVRSEWKLNDYYRNPGPIQFDGPNSGITNYMISPPRVEDLLRMEDRHGNKISNKLPGSESSQSRPKDEMKVPKTLLSMGSKFNDDLVISSLCRDLDVSVISKCLPHQTGRHNNRILQLREENFSGYTEIRENSQSKLSMSSSLTCESLGLILSCLSTPGAQNVICGLVNGLPSLKELVVFRSLSDFLKGKALKVDLTSEGSLNFFENSLNSGGCTFPNGVEEKMNDTLEKKNSVTALKANDSQELTNNSCVLSCKGLVSNNFLSQLLSFFNLRALAIVGNSEAASFGATLSEQLICMSLSGMKSEIPVVFVPVCLENSISHQMIEICVGFDSVTKSISTLVGNLLTDSASATKYWYFMKMIGEKTSNVALEVGIQTHPNLVVIPERYADGRSSVYGSEMTGVTLDDIITEICDIICLRSNQGNNFGGLLVSEGLFDQVYPTRECRRIFSRFSTQNLCNASNTEVYKILGSESLSRYERKIVEDFKLIFSDIDTRLIENLVNSNKICDVRTEIILSALVQKELKFRRSKNKIKNGMNSVCFSFTDQVRACFPSDFDSTLGLMYGMLASKIISSNLVGGYATGIKGVLGQTDSWNMYAIPISSLMTLDIEGSRGVHGLRSDFSFSFESKKFLTEITKDRLNHQLGFMCKLNSVNSRNNPSFRLLMNHIEKWEIDNTYANPGPIQYFNVFKNLFNRTLFESEYIYTRNLKEIDQVLLEIKTLCQLGVEKDVLNSTIQHLKAIQNSISIMSSCNHRKSKPEQIECIQKKNSIGDYISNLKCRNHNSESNLEIISEMNPWITGMPGSYTTTVILTPLHQGNSRDCSLVTGSHRAMLPPGCSDTISHPKPLKTPLGYSWALSQPSMIVVVLLSICTCSYLRPKIPGLIDNKKAGFLGILGKMAVIGDRLRLSNMIRQTIIRLAQISESCNLRFSGII
ncbi:pyrophosphate-dependent 6-phosphofructokinase [Cryptosporidium sp. chipmunk genotype I]|uniref:pyrophosphate-dependent 6-phosphofructokinase n=1 Tax=Cryptosporidium sp. chipmunk genotype I TaxID=1280935 RepID=UPI00351A6A58|nr:pyrophosphate-dependent 6-phosphofructokinase [Cryptosporidium sp. chipmunk genotype I]